MANAMTNKEFDSIKKETFFFFAFKDGQRIMTYGGLNLLEAMKQQALYQAPDCVTLIAHQSRVKGHAVERDIKAFEYLFNMKMEVLENAN